MAKRSTLQRILRWILLLFFGSKSPVKAKLNQRKEKTQPKNKKTNKN